MEGEISNVVFVWATAFVSLLICHTISKHITPGMKRLFAFLPVVCIFVYLPTRLTTVHFSGSISFFITWLANFKLLLFAFDKGPLYSLPLIKFILTASLPIKITKTNPHNSKSHYNYIYAIKFMVFVFLLKVYEYGEYIHPLLKMTLFCIHIYVVLDLGLAIVAYVARAIIGFDLEPQFNEPYLATSLQDFWGKRWNLMVTGILHPTVYLPVRKISGRYLTGPKLAPLAPFPAVLASFIVSGLMHELIFYYIGRLKPTWEVTWFFVVHGVLLGVEVVVKRVVGRRFHVPAVVSGVVALSLVVFSSFWLFFPPFLRCDVEVRSCKEFVAFMELVVRGRFVGPNDVSCPYL